MIARRTCASLLAVVSLATLAACTSDSTSTPESSVAAISLPSTVVSAATTASAPLDTTGETTGASTSETGPATSDGTESSSPPASTCAAPTDTTPVSATAADTVGQEWDVTSFDGTVIRAHWFPLPGLAAGATAPTVLMGPGWGSSGDTDVSSVGLLGALNIATLRNGGFNVLTWDPRGFGKSTGEAEVDSPDYEGRDVQQLLDWVATQPQVALDGIRDPRVGMVGGSYGGGIQLVTAALDCRVDAIVPVIAWHSLQTSLFKADTPKTGWSNLLATASLAGKLDPTIARANLASNSTGTIDPADVQWFADRGPGDLVSKITVPTLLIQGTVDTLFTLDEAVTNFDTLTADGVPAAMLWFCGGHGVCLTDAGDTTRLASAAVAWLQHYVSRDTTVGLGATFEFVDQDGVSYTADSFPQPTATPLTASGTGTLRLVADGGAGPAVARPGGGLLGSFVATITPARATNAVDVAIAAPPKDTVLVGAPQLSLTYSGTAPDGDRPERVFAQLVDDATGVVLGNQITPIEVNLDGQPHTVEVPLEMIAFTAHAASTVTLQIVATTVSYATPRLGGSIDFQNITVTLPVVDGVSKR